MPRKTLAIITPCGNVPSVIAEVYLWRRMMRRLGGIGMLNRGMEGDAQTDSLPRCVAREGVIEQLSANHGVWRGLSQISEEVLG